MNDSLSTTVCLQWEPEIIAVALIHLASKLSKFTVVDWIGRTPQHCRWWDMFVADVTMEILEDICHQVLDLYQTNQSESVPESPPQLPPSKASPPMKRANMSPVHTKSSPNNNHRPPLDEKVEGTTGGGGLAPGIVPIGGAPIPKIISDNIMAQHHAYPPAPYGNLYPATAPAAYQHPTSQYPPAMPPSAPTQPPVSYGQQPYPPVPPPHYPPPAIHHPPSYYGQGRPPYYHQQQ